MNPVTYRFGCRLFTPESSLGNDVGVLHIYSETYWFSRLLCEHMMNPVTYRFGCRLFTPESSLGNGVGVCCKQNGVMSDFLKRNNHIGGFICVTFC